MTSFNFKYSKQFLGIFMVFMGSPLIFFLKEATGFGGGSFFTIGGLLLGLVLMISPTDIFRKFYKPFLPTYRLAAVFTFVALTNFLLVNPDFGWYGDRSYFYRDFGNYLFIFAYFFLLMGVSNNVKDHFLPIVVSLTFLGSVALIYSISTNPYYILGQRASVVFGDGTSVASGNPHVYARNAFAGVFASYLMLKSKNLLWQIFSIINIFLSLTVLVLAQARSILLAFFFALAVFAYFNISRKSFTNVTRSLFKPRILLLITLLVAGVAYFISTQQGLINIINIYFETFSKTFTRALLTATGGTKDSDDIDYSAMGRVNSFASFKQFLYEKPWKFFLGSGFRYNYMDIPILETLIDCGIVAFVSFGLMNWLFFVQAMKAIKDRTNDLTVFLSYFYLTYFVGIFTGGEPYSTSYWFIFCTMIRFVGIKYLQPMRNNSHTQIVITSPSILKPNL